MCADSRFGKPRFFPVRETVCHFLRRAKSNQKARGTPSCDLDSKLYRRKILAKISDGTSRNQRFAQDDGEKALNRCDVPVLLRKDLERTGKEQPYSFADSRLWLGANLRCLRWKRIALDSKKRFWKKERFLVCKKGGFRVHLEKFSAIGNVFAEKAAFSIHEKPTNKEKLFLSTAKLQPRTAPKLTCNNPFRIPLATVSLQKALSFS